ncbi:MAG: ABC transporter substrate-binding protein, partial [Agromyces sp.]
MNITKSVGLAAAVLVAATTLTGCTADSGGTTEITYALWGKPQLPLMKQLVAEFEEQHPEISVNIDLTPYAQYFTKLQTQASSDTLPDIFWMNSNVFPLYASNGQLEPITQAIDDGDLVLDDYPAILAKTYEWDGVQYGVPKDFDTIALWYNKALFDEAGQAYPTDDWTWDQYKSVSQEISATLKDKGVFGTALP